MSWALPEDVVPLLWLLLTTAVADGWQIRLPPEESATSWQVALADAGLSLGDAPDVVVEVEGSRWWVVARAEGHERRVSVVIPRTDAERADVAWLAASLVQDVWSQPEPPLWAPRPSTTVAETAAVQDAGPEPDDVAPAPRSVAEATVAATVEEAAEAGPVVVTPSPDAADEAPPESGAASASVTPAMPSVVDEAPPESGAASASVTPPPDVADEAQAASPAEDAAPPRSEPTTAEAEGSSEDDPGPVAGLAVTQTTSAESGTVTRSLALTAPEGPASTAEPRTRRKRGRDRRPASAAVPEATQSRTTRSVALAGVVRGGSGIAVRAGASLEARGEIGAGLVLADHLEILTVAAVGGPSRPLLDSAEATVVPELGGRVSWSPPWRWQPELGIALGASRGSWRELGTEVAAGWVPWVGGRAAFAGQVSRGLRLGVDVQVLRDLRDVTFVFAGELRVQAPLRTVVGVQLSWRSSPR
jgi:hypothetical protein